MTGGAAGRILIDGQETGSGFTITDDRALTAGHVMRPVTEKMPSGPHLPASGPPEPTVVCVRDHGKSGPVGGVETLSQWAVPASGLAS